MPETDAIVCEIHTPHAAQAGVLAEATAMVARSIGQSVIVKTLAIGKGSQDALLTLHLPAALVGTQHRVWCMGVPAHLLLSARSRKRPGARRRCIPSALRRQPQEAARSLNVFPQCNMTPLARENLRFAFHLLIALAVLAGFIVSIHLAHI